MKLGQTGTWICVALSVCMLIYIFHVLSRDLPDQNFYKSLFSFSDVAPPLVLHVDKDHGIVPSDVAENGSASNETINTSYVIEKSDMDYYRDNKKALVKDYEARVKLYEPRKEKERESRLENTATNPLQRPPANAAVQIDAVILAQLFDEMRVDTNSQNVHDIAVQDTTKRLFSDSGPGVLDALFNPNAALDVPVEIIEFAQRSDFPKHKINDVRFVVAEIYKRDAQVSNVGKKESEVLSQVWQGGNPNVRRQVLNELLDCKKQDPWDESPTIYCPTGVVTRIVAASAIETPEKMARTKEVLRKEMLETAAKVRADLERDPAFGILAPLEQSAKLKETLEDTYDRAYDGVVSKDVVRGEMNEWIDAI